VRVDSQRMEAVRHEGKKLYRLSMWLAVADGHSDMAVSTPI
jgi:hypothetical protein